MLEPTRINDIPEVVREFNRARLKGEVSEGISELMRHHGFNRTRLADYLNVEKSRVSHMLSGAQNFRLDTLADLFLVLGRAVHITLGISADEYRFPVDEAIAVTAAETHAFDWNTLIVIEETEAPFYGEEDYGNTIGTASIAGRYPIRIHTRESKKLAGSKT